ncbi:MAG: DUF2239 family protein [Trueperaceae bacterium]|nr:DUF2239 family protein [Trueperaceae bacterium]
MQTNGTFTSFHDVQKIASGTLAETLATTRTYLDSQGLAKDQGSLEHLLIFHDQTGRQVEFDLRGTSQEVLERNLPQPETTGPGRPKLGVVSKEVTLLPRHWEWLESQPKGISGTLRLLVDEARRHSPAVSAKKLEAIDKFMLAMAGNLAGYEEASRALYSRDFDRLERQISAWPEDIQSFVRDRLAAGD